MRNDHRGPTPLDPQSWFPWIIIALGVVPVILVALCSFAGGSCGETKHTAAKLQALGPPSVQQL